MKMVLLLKPLLNCCFKIYKNLMAFHYHLLQIEAFGLFQEFRKIFARSFVFLSTYLYLSTQKQMVKERLLIQK